VIPGAFAYHRPGTVPEALALLAELGDEARPLAGGHSLIPMMKLRMAAPGHLVDLRGVGSLRAIEDQGADIVIGCMVTLAEIARSDLLAEAVPILRETALQIADPQVRYLGTIGGNVANGDPGNDMPAVMMALGATYDMEGAAGKRGVAARSFYDGAYETALRPGEIVTAIRIPRPPGGHGSAYEKLKRKVGDYATAAAAVVLTIMDGHIATCSIALTNVAEVPLFADQAAQVAVGSAGDAATLKQVAAAAEAIARPASDARGPAEYRRKMAGIMAARALARAAAGAGG
jgi:carbon-monoxide dehydrogenase medium subunit